MESAKAQATAIPWVDDNLCAACSPCEARAVCRSKALVRLDPGESPFVDASQCYGCQLCIAECPHSAIRRASQFQPLGS